MRTWSKASKKPKRTETKENNMKILIPCEKSDCKWFFVTEEVSDKYYPQMSKICLNCKHCNKLVDHYTSKEEK